MSLLVTRYCPECKKQMSMARWLNMWTCEYCDIIIDITKEERKLITKYYKK